MLQHGGVPCYTNRANMGRAVKLKADLVLLLSPSPPVSRSLLSIPGAPAAACACVRNTRLYELLLEPPAPRGGGQQHAAACYCCCACGARYRGCWARQACPGSLAACCLGCLSEGCEHARCLCGRSSLRR